MRYRQQVPHLDMNAASGFRLTSLPMLTTHVAYRYRARDLGLQVQAAHVFVFKQLGCLYTFAGDNNAKRKHQPRTPSNHKAGQTEGVLKSFHSILFDMLFHFRSYVDVGVFTNVWLVESLVCAVYGKWYGRCLPKPEDSVKTSKTIPL